MEEQKAKIAELEKMNRQLKHELAKYKDYDILTGLYEKKVFYCVMEHTLEQNEVEPYSVVCIDIERFKIINDVYGIAEGDNLLQYVGTMVEQEATRLGGVAARIAGDIFSIFAPTNKIVLDQITEVTFNWFKNYPLKAEIIPVLGIYHIDDLSVPISVMCDRALLALNSVKGSYLQHSAVYHSSLRSVMLEEQELREDAKRALAQKEFKIYVQPKVDMPSGQIIGAEALVRWEHPKKGLMSPANFIPFFERNGFIVKLDYFVWEEVCKLVRAWIDGGHTAIPISINISRVNLYHTDFVKTLVSLVDKYKLSHTLIELELTESIYATDTKQMICTVDALRANGFVILMDDFGSAYSSLNMLSDINVDVLKLDLRFLESKRQGRIGNILEAVVRMAKWLNIKVIAEGVETQAQADFLISMGCTAAQGYLFYQPMPAAEFEQIIQNDEAVNYGLITGGSEEELTFSDLFYSDAMSNILLNNIVDGVGLYEYCDGVLHILRVNDGYQKLVCGDVMNVQGNEENILNYVVEADRHLLVEALEHAVGRTDQCEEVQYRRRRLDGSERWISARILYLSDRKGKLCYYASLVDISEQKKEEERRLKQSVRDKITGLYERIPFEMKVEALLSNDTLEVNGILIFIELQAYKSIQKGFLTAQDTEDLERVGKLIFDSFGEDVLAGHIAPGHIAIFLHPIMTQAELSATVAGLCKKLTTSFKPKANVSPPHFRVGVAKQTTSPLSYEKLYQYASEALAYAKNLKDKPFVLYDSIMFKEHNLFFNIGSTLLDELDKIICVIQNDDLTLQYCSKSFMKHWGIQKRDWKGKHCYNVIFGRSERCEGCTQRRTSYKSFFTFYDATPHLGGEIEIHEKLFNWYGKELRYEIITPKESVVACQATEVSIKI